MNEQVLFAPHPKQQYFLEQVFKPEYSFLSYGGAAGGGKTFVGLGCLILLCRLYKNSRWCVIRRSLTEIKLNTIPSFWKVCPTNFVQTWNKSEHTCTFKNGSSIIFKGENIDDDPELMWMDGLEVNGFLLEQVEELSQKIYDKAKLRAGRHIVDPMPPIKILMTLNPAQNWAKQIIYTPYIEEKLEAPYCYVPAFIEDNPSLPEQYVSNLKYLDELTYRRYVRGDWDAFAVNNPYAYAFSKDKHVKECELDVDFIQLSFDFNRDPITCIVGQSGDFGTLKIVKEFRLAVSDIYELCTRIKIEFPNQPFIITGDATGRASSALVKGKINYYTVIKQELELVDTQMKQPTINPAHEDARVLLNSILQNGELQINPACEFLIDDLLFCEVDENGELNKKKDKRRTHLLDCLIYFVNTFHKPFLKM